GPRRDGASAQARRPVGRAGVHYSDLATVPRPLLLLLPPHPPADRADDLEARLRLRLPPCLCASLSGAGRAGEADGVCRLPLGRLAAPHGWDRGAPSRGAGMIGVLANALVSAFVVCCIASAGLQIVA